MTARRPSGLTSTELLVTLALCAILLSLAMPDMGRFLQRQKISTTASDLMAALALTRAESIRRNERVELTPVDSTNWASGWVIRCKGKSESASLYDGRIIHAHGPVARGVTITSAMSDASKPYVAYVGSGHTRTNGSHASPQAGHFDLALGSLRRRIILNFSGRARLCNPDADRACG